MSFSGKVKEELLEHYDDGRRKSYFCLAVNLLELEDTEDAMRQLSADAKTRTPKERAAAAVGVLQAIAQKRGVILKLRKPEAKSKNVQSI